MPKLHALDEYEIVRFHKQIGDTVKRGDIFLDARLFDGSERPVAFYVNGTITEINAKIGDCVSEDDLLGVVDDGK
jgi:Pyruvate/2-oxoglutarate dehydrogenase complex, dihydrolipoamide acyltransferase (E2) component, and related enzymes